MKNSMVHTNLKNPLTGELVTDNNEKANLLNLQYQSQFPQECLDDLPTEKDSNFPSMPNIVVREEGVVKLLKNLNSHKAAGPDEISPWVLNTAAEEIAPALTAIFRLSLDTGGYTQ